MRLLLIVIVSLLAMPHMVWSAVDVIVQVSWTARPDAEGPSSYKVYYGTGGTCGPGASSVLGQVSHPTTSLTASISLNQPTTYRFCVTSSDTAGNEGVASISVTKLLNPFWSESFETTSLPFWTQNPSGLNGTVVVSDTDKTDGIRSLRLTFADAARVGGPFLDRPSPVATEMFTRFWIRSSPGFTWGSPYTTIGSFGAGTTAPIVALVNSTLTGGAPYMVVQTAKESGYGSESLVQNQGTPVAIDSTWACVEIRVKYNTPGVANGIAQYWVGNVLVGDYQNREFLGASPSDPAPSTATMSFVRLHNDRGLGDVYLDQLQISNQRLGCTGIAPPTSVTVIAPSNLRFSTGTAPSTIAVDADSQSSAFFNTNTTNWSHTVGAGTNRALLVACQERDTTSADTLISSITFGAQALTSLRTDTMSSSDPARTSWWGLVSPTTGTSTITATFAGIVSQGGCYAISLTGVNQTAMLAGSAGTVDTTGSSEVSTSIANLTAGAWAFDTVWQFNEFGIVVGSGQTQRNNRVLAGSYLNPVGVSSVGPLPSSVTQDMRWTLTPPAADRFYVQSVILVAPEAGTGSTDVIQWDDNSTDETGFEGEWKHDGTGGLYVPLFSVGPNVTTYPNPITTETNVSIRVKAVRSADISEWSNILSTIPPTTPPPDPGDPIVVPPPPTQQPPSTVTEAPTVSGNLPNGVTILSWTSDNNTESTQSQYVVEWTNYQTGTNGWRAVGTTSPKATGFIHRYTPFVPAGESEFWVCYRVKAVTSAGTSSYSPQTCHDVDVFTPLSTPSVQIPSSPIAVFLQ